MMTVIMAELGRIQNRKSRLDQEKFPAGSLCESVGVLQLGQDHDATRGSMNCCEMSISRTWLAGMSASGRAVKARAPQCGQSARRRKITCRQAKGNYDLWAFMYSRSKALMRVWYPLPWARNHSRTSASRRRVTCFLCSTGLSPFRTTERAKSSGEISGISDTSISSSRRLRRCSRLFPMNI